MNIYKGQSFKSLEIAERKMKSWEVKVKGVMEANKRKKKTTNLGKHILLCVHADDFFALHQPFKRSRQSLLHVSMEIIVYLRSRRRATLSDPKSHCMKNLT